MFSFLKSSKPPSLPPACSECVQTSVGPMGGALPQTSSFAQYRSPSGLTRFDMGNFSMISNPATGERTLLNHLTQEARILPPQMPGMAMPAMAMPATAMPAMPGMPQMPAMPGAPNIIQLGKSMIEGHPVQGVRYVFPQTGLTPPPLSSWEVWNSTKLNMPVMTQSIGSFGQQTSLCKVSATPPSPSMFQIPPGYKVVQPPAPQSPGAPSLSNALPSAPSLSNGMPSAPNVSAPNVSTPNVAAPKLPSLK